ncbi:TrmB family transcriptional regulator [Halobellus inordinatus]|uniref:TrmB family transcriptional regulator n=1 Tax=Halobellus inordinatus TaxID=1126236 RepID=UPI00210AFE36|nr:helix-turn-helix domain-containing protein [Halobellus inordinatus]
MSTAVDTDISEHEAVESLERLGLSNYAAQVFVALQSLNVGTAKQIHEETDVPRSQEYGAAEELADFGLVEIQKSTPKRYRPVSLDTARGQFAERLKREADRAFSFLKAQRETQVDGEMRGDVWITHGRDPVHHRVGNLPVRRRRRYSSLLHRLHWSRRSPRRPSSRRPSPLRSASSARVRP